MPVYYKVAGVFYGNKKKRRWGREKREREREREYEKTEKEKT